jgi:hypothetical protein
MTARQDIEKYLGQWLELTQEEAGAIQLSKWKQLREIQSAKESLKSSLSAARERMLTEIGSWIGTAIEPLRAEVGRLASLEGRNAALLTAKMKKARVEQEKRVEAQRNLRRLRRSYGSVPDRD